MTVEMEQVKQYYDQVGDTFDASYAWDGPLYPSNRIRLDHALEVLDGRLRPGARVLDAGCGTGIAMAELLGRGYDAMGYDFSGEAIRGARHRLGPDGWRVWVGDLEEPVLGAGRYDGALVIGAFTHPVDTEAALRHLWDVLRPGATLVVELRNELFDLFTANTYTVASLRRWLPDAPLVDAALAHLATHAYVRPAIAPDTPVQRAHEAFFSVPAVWRNPLTVAREYADAGFRVVDQLGFHFHAVPPVFEPLDPVAFRQLSLEMERDPHDWRWHFMASAFLLVAEREG